MATSREPSQFSRIRSSTAQSSTVSLDLGDSKVLNAWVHDVKDSPAVIFNHSWWPGVAEGDLLKVVSSNADNPESAFLFMVPRDEGCPKPQLQISVPRPIADIFSLRNNGEVTLTKVDKAICCADYVEFMLQDQYLGRNDMWRLGRYLSGQCIYEDQEVSFTGGVAKIQNIYIDGEKVSSACMTTSTKAIYRSLSAKATIFIQVCTELWEFAGDGERYNEKIVHSFLPTLFAKWREAGTNHIVTIVLISRVFYDDSEIDYAAGPLRRDERGNWYKDFFKVITDLEVIYEWKQTLVSLKNSFWDFQRDILLTHHFHQAAQDSAIGAPAQVRLVGRLSYAQDGPILEALNLGLISTETHYIDRSLNLTGASTLLITPGTGYFRVSKQLLRSTTTRMLDQGFVLDLILLTKPPLHQSPILSFEGTEPVAKLDKEGHDEKDGNFDPLMMDPLWGGDDDSNVDARVKKTFWWEPFWMATTFWDKQMDLPFRQDRFVARAKMHEIQMMGLLEHDVLSSIEVPFLPDKTEPPVAPLDVAANVSTTKSEADIFDLDTFSLTSNYGAANVAFDLADNSSPALRAYADKRASHRNSAIIRISTIEESPKRIHLELPSESLPTSEIGPASANTPVRSPSPTSIRSARSAKSTASSRTSGWSGSLSKGTLASKLAPSWLFNPFRSGPSEPQTTQVSASASPIAGSHRKEKQKESMEKLLTTDVLRSPKAPTSSIRMPPPSKPTVASSTQQVQPMAIRNRLTNRSNLSRTFEEETIVTQRSPYIRRSPISTPPPDDTLGGKRRSAASTLAQSYTSMSPGTIMNPTRPQVSISQSQASLARRWQHFYPHSKYKYDFNWKSLVTPGCVPLTVEHMPSNAELDSSFDVFSYEFIVDPSEMRSFLVKPPVPQGTAEDLRRAWALVVMRGMAAVRLSQGFQFILKPSDNQVEADKSTVKRTKSLIADEDLTLRPAGEVLSSTTDPVYLGMTNEIHRIVYTGETIQVRRYVRRMNVTRCFAYQCLIWPKLGGGYTELSTIFKSDGLENYGWNRLDMLVAGYEHHFNESLRYWRTRFIVIPTSEAPHITVGPSDEILSSEEARILGIEKLAEHFTKLRWQPPDETPHPPVRLLHTTLDPAASVLDEDLMDNLDQVHAAGPLRKKMKSEREIAEMSLSAIAKAMREEGAVPIKFYQWHHNQYPNSFTGYDFVSWLVREFRDVSSRTQAAELGVQFQAQGLFEHCRGRHTFLDGHYYYRLIGEYAVHTTPKYWFRRNTEDGTRPAYYHLNPAKQIIKPAVGRRNKKRLILSQTMVIDVDPLKRSHQAESVILHHDIIHNPGTVFHFELQWIGTTARCIEDQLRHWNRTIERYGLKLVEAYVTQISEIRDRNPFQCCFPIRLALPPPIVPDLEKRIPESKQSVQYFEYELLKAFDFILDVEAANLYPEQVDVVYSYRRSPYEYSQFVHRSGVAFIQVLGGDQGFLFLINRLMGPGRMGSALKNKSFQPATTADDIRVHMTEFCLDKEKLQQFYDKLMVELPPAPLVAEEPPPLVL